MAEMSGKRRRAVTASTTGIAVLLIVLLAVMVNYLGNRYFKRLDWTSSQLYTLSEKSKNVAASLDEPVRVTVFASPGSPLAAPVEEILERYRAESPRIEVRTVDPERDLATAERLLTEIGARYQQGTVKVVFEQGGERRIFEEDDLAEFDFSNFQMGGEPQLEAFKGEEAFTAALMQLATGEQPRVLFTTGHGERRIDDLSGRGLASFVELIGRDNVDTESWSSIGAPRVPEGTDLVVVAGPTAGFLPPELEVFGRYLEAGGRMLWLLDPVFAEGGGGLVDLGLDDWLAGQGIELGGGLLVDPDRAMPFFGDATIFLQDYGNHPVIRALAEADVPVLVSVARSVGAAASADAETVAELFTTSAYGWGETDFENLDDYAPGDGDRTGPVPVGVAIERPATAAPPEPPPVVEASAETGEEGVGEEGAGAEGDAEEAPEPTLRLVVIGDSDFAADSNLANAGNAALVDNAFNWLVEQESFLGIPPKRPEQTRLEIDGDQLLRLYLLIALLPLAAIVGGVAVWMRRRR